MRPAESNDTASPSNRRAPRDTETLRSPRANCIGSASAAPWRYDRAGARDAVGIEQPGMVEEVAGQARALAQTMFLDQLAAGVACRQIKRILVAHVAGDAELPHQRFQAGDRTQAGAIGARRRAQSRRPPSVRSASGRFPTATSRCWPPYCRGRGSSRSTMTTSRPCRVRRSATSDPVIPAPTISASHLRFSPISRRAGSPAPANHGERPPRRSACSVSSVSRTLMTAPQDADAEIRRMRAPIA